MLIANRRGMLSGPILAALDAGHRTARVIPFFGLTDAGATLFFLPAWLWGIFWTGLGAWYHFG